MDGARKKRGSQKPNRLILSRTLIVMIACGVLTFALLVMQLYKIQIVNHDLYQSEAVEQQVRETTINASRGTIYDTNMKILAMSATVDTIYISPVEMLKYEEDPSLIASRLSDILGVSYDSIMKKWEDTSSWYKTIAVKVEQDISEQVRAFKSEYNLKSVHIMEDTKRYYPYSSLAAQIIGFVGVDNNGLDGIESMYESKLRGVNGRIVRATTSEGTDMLFTNYENYYDAINGKSIVLTIDSPIQYYLEKHLEQAIKDNDVADGAMGIVMEVDTGAILGMATLPDYDLNNFLELNDYAKARIAAENLTDEALDEAYENELFKQYRNRTIADTYEPGSTFKIITLAAALEEGVATESSHYYCGGSVEVIGRKPVDCWHTVGHGDQDLALSTQHSCNVAYVKLGLQIGAKKMYEYIKAFGFFEKTGVDLAGEETGLWWPDEVFEDPLNMSQLAATAFGQTFNITPLQLITAVSAVANGGYLMKPYIVRQILDADGNIIESKAPTVVRQVISEDTSHRVCDILESVVASPEGTGKNAYVAGYRIAGKTGTGEKIGQQIEDEWVVSFVGFAPADDPKIAVLVLLDNPSTKSGIYISGGVMAAPVVGNIFADVLPYLGVEEIYADGEIVKQNITLPNVKSYTPDEARNTLESLGFDVRITGSGDTVIDQLPIPNVSVTSGSTIILYTDSQKPDSSVIMPNLFDMTYVGAKQYMEDLGLFIRCSGVTPSSSDTIVVARQSIEAGNEIAFGSVVEVTLIDNDSSIIEGR